MPNPNPIEANSPTVSPFSKDCTMHTLYTDAKTFADVVLLNHVGEKEFKSIVGDGIGVLTKKKKSNYSSFQDLRSSYNRDMVMYKGPRPSTTQARALNEKSSKKIPPATSQPPKLESQLPGRKSVRPTDGFAAQFLEPMIFISF
ncbi:hypothetical protein Tco_0606960 [Tanacetum coccineum]